MDKKMAMKAEEQVMRSPLTAPRSQSMASFFDCMLFDVPEEYITKTNVVGDDNDDDDDDDDDDASSTSASVSGDDNDNNSDDTDNVDSADLCDVCYMAPEGPAFEHRGGCAMASKWCMDCMRRNVATRINEGDVVQTCPGCGDALTTAEVEAVIGDDAVLLARLARFTKFQQDKNFRSCPGQGCSAIMLGSPDRPEMHCTECKTSFCFFHELAHRPGPCPKVRSPGEMAGYLRSRLWAAVHTHKCPHCKERIEKNGGCPNMTCRNCGKTFCWICRCKTTSYCSHTKIKRIGYTLSAPVWIPLGIVAGVVAGVSYLPYQSYKKAKKSRQRRRMERRRKERVAEAARIRAAALGAQANDDSVLRDLELDGHLAPACEISVLM